jgi:hypothetical protein
MTTKRQQLKGEDLGKLRDPEGFLESKWDFSPFVQYPCFDPKMSFSDVDGHLHLGARNGVADWIIWIETKNTFEECLWGQRGGIEGSVRQGRGNNILYIVRASLEERDGVPCGDVLKCKDGEEITTNRGVTYVAQFEYSRGSSWDNRISHIKPTPLWNVNKPRLDEPGGGYQLLVETVHARYLWMKKQRQLVEAYS